MSIKLKLSPQDVLMMEAELNRGCDIKIQRTGKGYRIVADKVTVLKKVEQYGTEAKN